jgi:hypothetical protein
MMLINLEELRSIRGKLQAQQDRDNKFIARLQSKVEE